MKNNDENIQSAYGPSEWFLNQSKYTYYTCDGKKVATMEEVMQYNQAFYEIIKKSEETEYNDTKKRHK